MASHINSTSYRAIRLCARNLVKVVLAPCRNLNSAALAAKVAGIKFNTRKFAVIVSCRCRSIVTLNPLVVNVLFYLLAAVSAGVNLVCMTVCVLVPFLGWIFLIIRVSRSRYGFSNSFAAFGAFAGANAVFSAGCGLCYGPRCNRVVLWHNVRFSSLGGYTCFVCDNAALNVA